MSRRNYTRRVALQSIGLGAVAGVAASTGASATTRVIPDGQRDDERIQFVEADPEAGFNYPYLLGTPETFRSAPVPLLVTMNSAREGMPLTADGQDNPPTVARRARTQIQMFEQIGPWVSERLGIPQLVPVFPLPDGDPVDNTHKTLLLDRETMLIEGTDLERIDRQLLRMTEHARQEILSDTQMHDQLLFWGNSFGGVAAEHMAVLHPEEIMAFAGAGINGIATLPLETLGSHTLKYPIGVADLQTVTGSPFNAEAFDDVNKFYIQGGRDTHNRLKFHEDRPEGVDKTPVWNDPDVYATAKAVYGRDMVDDRLPRCHVAFEKATVSGQFRVYPEMSHDPVPAAPAVLEFLRRSIEGDDVSEFGQRLGLPFDRTVALRTDEPAAGDELDFVVSSDYPPPAGLVTYTWAVDDGRSASGPTARFRFDDAGDYTVTVTMETAHGQVTQRGMSLMTSDDSSIAAYRYDVTLSGTELVVGESIQIEINVMNVGSEQGDHRVELLVDGDPVDSRGAELDPGSSKRIRFSHPFDETGEYEVRVPPAVKQTIPVHAERTQTPEIGSTPAQTETQSPGSPTDSRDGPRTSAQGPGFGAVSALAGVGSVLSYLLLKDSSDR